MLQTGERVVTEFGAGVVTDSSARRVVIRLDAGDVLNVVTGTPGYGRIVRDNGSTCPGCGQSFSGARGLRSHRTARFVTLACRA